MPILGEVKKARELGYKGNDRRIWAACEMCGAERWVFIKDNQPKNKWCVHCFLKTRSRENNHNWKGGKFKTMDGYVKVLVPEHPHADNKGYVLEHRLVLEQKLGRLLKQSEVGHHLNGIKNDNRPENLAAMSKKHNSSTLVIPYKKRIKELELAIEKLIGED